MGTLMLLDLVNAGISTWKLGMNIGDILSFTYYRDCWAAERSPLAPILDLSLIFLSVMGNSYCMQKLAW
jgi:hypothetical protein